MFVAWFEACPAAASSPTCRDLCTVSRNSRFWSLMPIRIGIECGKRPAGELDHQAGQWKSSSISCAKRVGKKDAWQASHKSFGPDTGHKALCPVSTTFPGMYARERAY